VTVAVNANGTLVHSRAFGWSDAARTKALSPDAMMRVASVSKPFTPAIVKDLVRDNKLALDTRVFPYLGLRSEGAPADPRLSDITVQQLLDHKAGWDRDQAFDPMFRVDAIAAALSLRGAPTPGDVIRYMIGQPLQFAPGSRSAYSNFGYCVPGRAIERATGKSYAEVLQDAIAKPLGIRHVAIGHASSSRRDPREVSHPVSDDDFALDVMDAHGGIVASAPALCRFMQAYWVDGTRRNPGQTGCKGSSSAAFRERRHWWRNARTGSTSRCC
jgi:N-acyl-D-amino-acid deacylase